MTLAEGLPKDNRFVTYTDWNGYMKFLEAVGDRPIRITYDRGFLEIMSPLPEHERLKTLIGSLLEQLAVHLGVPMQGAGNTTFRRQDLDRGLEPDECYWFAHADCFSDHYDPMRDPPPDLVVEIDITRRSTRRMNIYRAMGVPEVWRYARRKGLQVFSLAGGQYEQCLSSPTFPQISLAELRRHLEMGRQLSRNQTQILRSWRDYLRQQVPEGD